MDDDDRGSRGSLEAAAGGSDAEGLSGDSFVNDDPVAAADLDDIAGLSDDDAGSGGGRRPMGRRDNSAEQLYSQERVLAGARARARGRRRRRRRGCCDAGRGARPGWLVPALPLPPWPPAACHAAGARCDRRSRLPRRLHAHTPHLLAPPQTTSPSCTSSCTWTRA